MSADASASEPVAGLLVAFAGALRGTYRADELEELRDEWARSSHGERPDQDRDIVDVSDARLVAALRDVAVYEASTARTPWRISWIEAAGRVRIELQDLGGADGALTVVRYEIHGEGISGQAELAAPATIGAILGYLVDTIGDVAAEVWREGTVRN